MKKKRLLLALSALWFASGNVCLASDPENDLKVSAEVWLANDSEYTEDAVPRTAIGPHGEISTNFFKLLLEKGFGNVILAGSLNLGSIQENRMYLDYAETDWVDIDGDIIGGEISGYYRVGDETRYIDFGAGYLVSHTTKEFYDHTVSGVPDPERQGNFGRFKMDHQILSAKVRGRVMKDEFGVEGRASYGKAWNDTTVEGWPGGTTNEETDGYDYSLELAALWTPMPDLEVKAGYRHERLYFDHPSEGSHDLDVRYNGPFLSAAWTF
jgi:hypothetical protein